MREIDGNHLVRNHFDRVGIVIFDASIWSSCCRHLELVVIFESFTEGINQFLAESMVHPLDIDDDIDLYHSLGDLSKTVRTDGCVAAVIMAS